jgi:hypothetical protein
MKYTPVKYTPLELLLKVGFIDTPNGRGYQLTIGSPKNTDVVLAERMHAYIDGNTIDYHRDKKGKGKSHIASSFCLRCRGLQDVFMYLDGQKEKIHPKNCWRKKFKELLS